MTERERKMIWRKEDEMMGEGGTSLTSQPGEVTVVGAGAHLEGSIVSAGSLRIDGQVTGRIKADGDVVLSAQSVVEADIDSANVAIAGKLKGNVVVKGKAELVRGGHVDGNITSRTLVVQEGGVFSGQSVMEQAGRQPSIPVAEMEKAKPEPVQEAPKAPVS